MRVNQTSSQLVPQFPQPLDCVTGYARPTQETRLEAYRFLPDYIRRSTAQDCREYSPSSNRLDLCPNSEPPSRDQRHAGICPELCTSCDERLKALCRSRRTAVEKPT